MTELIKILENYSEFEDIGENTTFKNDLELSSFDTVCIIEDINTALGVKILAKDFAKHKTVGELATYIAEKKA